MKRIWSNLNYIAIVIIILGFALLQSFGRSNLWGILALLLGFASFFAYLFINRERLKSKNSRLNFIFASNLVVIIILVIAIISAVNLLGSKIHKRVDFTEGKIHSLADQSIKVAKGLKKELAIKAFVSERNGATLDRFNSLMEIYKYYSDKIKSETIDPFKNPSLVKQYQIRTDGTVILAYDKKDTRIEEVSEEAITNAIIKVSRFQEKTVYILQGHGEPDPEKSDELGYSEVKTNLEKLSYKVKKLVLFQESEVPANASALVIAGLQKPLFEKEIYLIEDYIFKKQGKTLLMLNPDEGNELKPLLKKLGVALEDNKAVELGPLQSLMGADAFMPAVSQYGDHAITKNFGYATLFPWTRGIAKIEPLPKDVSVTILASTSPNSWGETNYEAEAKAKKITRDAQDKVGPLDIAAAAEVGSGIGQKARVVVIGNSQFSINKYYNFQANGNFFNNILNWLAEEGDLIAIAPKTAAPRAIYLTQSSAKLIFFYTIVILPLLVLICGIGVWWYRRKL